MSPAAGVQLVERDRVLLAALAIARYLTGEQVARLVFPGLHRRVHQRRLNKLACPGQTDPLVRALSYRGPTGAPLKAWALTEAGYVAAKLVVPHVAAPGGDVGPAFLEHSLLLNELLVELVVGVRAETGREPLLDLPFRWFTENGGCAEFRYYDRSRCSVEEARIRPDAILEIGEPRRRVFLECETGAHTLVSSDPTSTGATWAKIQRYTHLLAGGVGQHDARTPYSIVWPDGFRPVLLFLTASERRRDAIRKLVADPKRGVRITVRGYTFREAAVLLGALALGRRAQGASPGNVARLHGPWSGPRAIHQPDRRIAAGRESAPAASGPIDGRS